MSFLTNEGPDVPTASEFRELYENLYEQLAEEDQDWGRDTFLGAHSTALSEILAKLGATLQDFWDALDLDTARGKALDIHAALIKVDLQRRQATRSRAVIEVNQGQYIIEEGSLVVDEAGNEWQVVEDIDASQDPTGIVEAVEFGPIAAPANTINEIVTPIAGWDNVTNPSRAERGRLREEDPEFRQRIRLERRAGLGLNRLGIRSALLELPFVEKATVVHNPAPFEQEVMGVTLPQHSFVPIIFPKLLTEEEEDELLYEVLPELQPVGITFASPPEISEKRFGYFQGYPIRFSYFEEREISFFVNGDADLDNFSVEEIEAAIEEELEAFVDDLDIGEAIRYVDLACALRDIPGLLVVNNFIVTINGDNQLVDPSSPVLSIPSFVYLTFDGFETSLF